MVALAVPLAACSADEGAGPPTTAAQSPGATVATGPPVDLNATTTTTTGPAKISVRATSLGDILVDADGMTLYARGTDEADGCAGTCLDAWPQLRATSVEVSTGLDAARFTLVDPDANPNANPGPGPGPDSTATGLGEESTNQPPDQAPGQAPGQPSDAPTTVAPPPLAEGAVAVSGQVLHRFVGDAVPGDTTGHGFNRTFFVVLADGTLVRPPASTTTSTTTAP